MVTQRGLFLECSINSSKIPNRADFPTSWQTWTVFHDEGITNANTHHHHETFETITYRSQRLFFSLKDNNVFWQNRPPHTFWADGSNGNVKTQIMIAETGNIFNVQNGIRLFVQDMQTRDAYMIRTGYCATMLGGGFWTPRQDTYNLLGLGFGLYWR